MKGVNSGTDCIATANTQIKQTIAILFLLRVELTFESGQLYWGRYPGFLIVYVRPSSCDRIIACVLLSQCLENQSNAIQENRCNCRKSICW